MSISVQVSSQFKSSLVASIASIFLFIITYLLLFAFSIALVIGCGFLVLMLVSRGISINGIVINVATSTVSNTYNKELDSFHNYRVSLLD